MSLSTNTGTIARFLNMHFGRLSLLAVAFGFVCFAATAHAQQFPFGVQHQPYRAGTLTPTNFTQAELNQHVADYYDVWKGRWLGTDPGGNGWRVKSDSSGRTVSEGQGYGMVIVAAMAGTIRRRRRSSTG